MLYFFQKNLRFHNLSLLKVLQKFSQNHKLQSNKKVQVGSWSNSHLSLLLPWCLLSLVLGLLEPQLRPPLVPHSQTQRQQQHSYPRANQHKSHRGRFIPLLFAHATFPWAGAAVIKSYIWRHHTPHDHHHTEGDEANSQSTQCILGSWVSNVLIATVVVVVVVVAAAAPTVAVSLSTPKGMRVSIHAGTHLLSVKLLVQPVVVRSKLRQGKAL